MSYQPINSAAGSRLFITILLFVIICALLMPLMVAANGDGGDVPTPAPPPNGENQTIPDTTFMIPDGMDSTLYYSE